MTIHKIIINAIAIVAVCSLGTASALASQVTGVLSSSGVSPSSSQVSAGTVGGGGSIGGTVSGGSTSSSISSGGSSGEITSNNHGGSVLGASIVVPDPAFPIGGVRAGTPARAGMENNRSIGRGAIKGRATKK